MMYSQYAKTATGLIAATIVSFFALRMTSIMING